MVLIIHLSYLASGEEREDGVVGRVWRRSEVLPTVAKDKRLPRIQNTSRDVFRIVGSVFGFWNVFLDSGMCSGFWQEPAPDSGTCFWILGRVLDSGKCFWILGSGLSQYEPP